MSFFSGLLGKAEKGLKGRQKRIDAALKKAQGSSLRKGQGTMKAVRKTKR